MAASQSLSSPVQTFDAARSRLVNPAPTRLTGALAAGTVVTPNTTRKVRVAVAGVSKVRAIGKFSAHNGTGGNPTLALYGMAADAGEDDTVGTRHTKGDPAATAITGNGIFDVVRDALGEAYVEVELVLPTGSAVTIDWIDVLGI